MSENKSAETRAMIEDVFGMEGRMRRVNRLRAEAAKCRTIAETATNPAVAAHYRREAAICDRVADANLPGWKP